MSGFTFFSSPAGNDFHEHAVVATRSVGNQINKDNPGTQENKQSALNDNTTFNDGPTSSGNSMFCSFCSFFFLVLLVVDFSCLWPFLLLH